jgi:hypothetical protein
VTGRRNSLTVNAINPTVTSRVVTIGGMRQQPESADNCHCSFQQKNPWIPQARNENQCKTYVKHRLF